jgi:outer membrane translocation and assembly module TamA
MEGLTLTGSVSIQHFETQFPAARFQAANALETTLRYSTRWRESDSHGQELDAGYTLRAATNLLGTDYVYTRHAVHADYAIRHNEHLFHAGVLAGQLNGDAPLFDRFSLGNTRTLRGWNKFDIAPLGGDRVVHGSVGYRYRAVGFFYDAGSVWDHGKESEDRHSVGVTLALGALRDGPYLTLAFPLRNGAVQPLFMMGMNF